MTASTRPSAPVATMNQFESCDRCSARAVVRTMIPSGKELLWCGHHFAAHETALIMMGATVSVDR